MIRKQVQKANDAQQAGNDIVNNIGLDAGAVAVIMDAKADAIRAELTLHANTKVKQAFEKLESKLVPKLIEPKNINALADPDFQFNIQEAYRSAVRSGDENDIDLIVEVLQQRAQAKPTPRHKMATRRSLDVIGQLSSANIATLSILFLAIKVRSQNLLQPKNFSSLNHFYAPFVDEGTQENKSWFSDLTTLDCLHGSVGALRSLKSFAEIVATVQVPGYVAIGFDNVRTEIVTQKLVDINPLYKGFIVRHTYEAGRSMLLGTDPVQTFNMLKGLDEKLSDDQLRTIQSVVDENYAGSVDDFVSKIRSTFGAYDALKRVDGWWQNQLPPLELTPVGIVIGYGNVKRMIPGIVLPELSSLLE